MSSFGKILLSVLGEKQYLSFRASTFQMSFRMGGLGIDYQDLYFLKSIIGKGNHCVDIGAHLGYYTIELSRLVTDNGMVYAVEPVTKFNQALKHLLKRKKIRNVELFPLALGGDEDYMDMGIPEVAGSRKLRDEHTDPLNIERERVPNKRGDDLFQSLPRLDFVKCNVDGLEIQVFGSMMNSIARLQPILFCELALKKDRITLQKMLAPYSYDLYFLENKILHSMDVYGDKQPISHNHYFIPAFHQRRLKDLIRD